MIDKVAMWNSPISRDVLSRPEDKTRRNGYRVPGISAVTRFLLADEDAWRLMGGLYESTARSRRPICPKYINPPAVHFDGESIQ